MMGNLNLTRSTRMSVLFLAVLATQGRGEDQRSPPRRLVAVPLQGDFKKAKQKALKIPFCDPPVSRAKGEPAAHELCLSTGKFNNPGVAEVDPSIPMCFELLCYNGDSVGPTIRVRRGSKLRIRVKNDLLGEPDDDPGPVDGVPEGEKPHGLCTTNLHTHGLHVSPDGTADNVFQKIDPGEQLLFEYDIPAKHPAGTFWYHPHKHGSVAYQLSNGVAGALIVEGTRDDDIADLEDIEEIRNARDMVVLLQLYTYRLGDDGVGRIDASQIYNVQPDSKSCDEIKLTGPDDPNPPVQITAINGSINPTFMIAPGEVQRWRVVHAGWDLLRQLVWVDDNDDPTNVPDALEFHEIAVDGLATGSMTERNPLQIAPGQRSDVLIQGPPIPGGQDEVIYHLKQLPVANPLATHNRATDRNYLAKLVVRGKPIDMKLPDLNDPEVVKKLQACRPFDRVQDSELSTPTFPKDPARPQGTLQFFGSDDIRTYTIMGETFHQLEPLELPIGTAQEWTLTALKGSHPFHIHVNPFQVVSYTSADGFTVPMDVWRDTLYIPEGASYTIRSRFSDFVGESVLHCHILDHEDQGMMMRLRFVDPKKQKLATGPGWQGQTLADVIVPAPSFALPDTAGRVRRLSQFRGKSVILVFLRGLGCSHCTKALRELIVAVRGTRDFDGAIVAVSADAVDDAPKALRSLERVSLDGFYLLVDEARTAFHDFGCEAGSEPKHGLFLLDSNGVIRSQYIGGSPFANAAIVIEATRRLAP
jgi:FtsP/CotA-like multicopper oxidase with cupredoxin domain/peroxiredoxin